MKKQPDFQKIFFDHLGGQAKKVKYGVRQNSNRYHDLVFLSSLIHDARISLSDVGVKRKRMTIPINRDCWELGIVNKNNSAELYIADSMLTIFPVISVVWCFEHDFKINKEELWISSIWLDRPAENDRRKLIIEGHKWDCEITLKDENIRIVLTDIEVPCLYPKKEKGMDKTFKRMHQ